MARVLFVSTILKLNTSESSIEFADDDGRFEALCILLTGGGLWGSKPCNGSRLSQLLSFTSSDSLPGWCKSFKTVALKVGELFASLGALPFTFMQNVMPDPQHLRNRPILANPSRMCGSRMSNSIHSFSQHT